MNDWQRHADAIPQRVAAAKRTVNRELHEVGTRAQVRNIAYDATVDCIGIEIEHDIRDIQKFGGGPDEFKASTVMC